MEAALADRARGCAVGAAAGDAFGMPLEFHPLMPLGSQVRDMTAGRLAAGAFTDDTEMSLALAESLLAHHPLDSDDLARRFVGWYLARPQDIGIHTTRVLEQIARGGTWEQATASAQRKRPDSAGNGSLMRCWPVALANWRHPNRAVDEARSQSRVTHAHEECQAGCAFVVRVLCDLLSGATPHAAVDHALARSVVPDGMLAAIVAAPLKDRAALPNSGWVRHTVEAAVWSLLTTSSYEEAVIQVANLGGDADTSATVVGALAGAAYGLSAIPNGWCQALHGAWPMGSAVVWRAGDLIELSDRLVAIDELRA